MEKEQVIKLLAELVKMSKSESSEEALKVEYASNAEEIAKAREELAKIPQSSDELYFDQNAKLTDQQLESTFVKTIRELKTKNEKLKKQLDAAKKEEAELYVELQATDTSSSAKIIDRAKSASESAESREAKNFYGNIVATEEQTITAKNEKKNLLQAKYDEVQARIVSLSEEIGRNEEAIKATQHSLDDVRARLENSENYVDDVKIAADEKKIKEINEKIERLEARQVEIQRDPAMMASQAKEALLEGDNFGAMQKIQEIGEQVSQLPYMNVPNDEALAEAKKMAEEERNMLSVSISNKSYIIEDNETIEQIIAYYNQLINAWTSEIESLTASLTAVEDDSKYGISSQVSSLNNSIITSEAEVEQYANAIEGLDSTSTAKKVKLQAALNKKKAILDVLRSSLDVLKENEMNVINEAFDLRERIDGLKSRIEETRMVIQKLETDKLKLSGKSEDVIAKENDEAELKAAVEKTMNIIRRSGFDHTPMEIVEMIRAGLKLEVTPSSVKEEVVEQAEVVAEAVVAEEAAPVVAEPALVDVEDKIEVEQAEEKKEAETVSYQPAFGETVVSEPIVAEEVAPLVVETSAPAVAAVEEEIKVSEFNPDDTMTINLDELKPEAPVEEPTPAIPEEEPAPAETPQEAPVEIPTEAPVEEIVSIVEPAEESSELSFEPLPEGNEKKSIADEIAILSEQLAGDPVLSTVPMNNGSDLVSLFNGNEAQKVIESEPVSVIAAEPAVSEAAPAVQAETTDMSADFGGTIDLNKDLTTEFNVDEFFANINKTEEEELTL